MKAWSRSQREGESGDVVGGLSGAVRSAVGVDLVVAQLEGVDGGARPKRLQRRLKTLNSEVVVGEVHHGHVLDM